MESFSTHDQKVEEVMNIIDRVCSYDMSKVPDSMKAGVEDVLLYILNQSAKKIWDEQPAITTTSSSQTTTTTTSDGPPNDDEKGGNVGKLWVHATIFFCN